MKFNEISCFNTLKNENQQFYAEKNSYLNLEIVEIVLLLFFW